MDPQPDRSPARPKRGWLPFGTLRVRLRFAGVEVIDHRNDPPDLFGRTFAWDQIGRFGTFSRLEDESGSPVRSASRRWFVKIDDSRRMRVANRLRTRWIRNALRRGECVRHYARPETSMRWIMWTLATMLAVTIAYMFVAPAFGGGMGWFRTQPVSTQIVFVLTLTGMWLVHALMVGATYYFGWKAGLPVAQRMIYDVEGLAAEMSTGEVRQVEWTIVRRIRRDWTAVRLDLAGQAPIRLPMNVTTHVVLASMRDRTQLRDDRADSAARSDRIRSGLSRRLLWRVTVWSGLGGVLAALAMWWIQTQGLSPAPLTIGCYLAGIATFAFMPTLMWLVYLFGDAWNRWSRSAARKWRRRWQHFRT